NCSCVFPLYSRAASNESICSIMFFTKTFSPKRFLSNVLPFSFAPSNAFIAFSLLMVRFSILFFSCVDKLTVLLRKYLPCIDCHLSFLQKEAGTDIRAAVAVVVVEARKRDRRTAGIVEPRIVSLLNILPSIEGKY